MGRKEELANFFYNYYRMKICPFALPELIQEEGGRGSSNLLIALTDHRFVIGGGNNQGYDDNSSETDSLSCELNEAMDIDVLIASGSKKCKTPVGAVHVNPSSKEDESSTRLVHR